MDLSRNPQGDELLELLDTCHRVLPTLEDEDRSAEVLRDVCKALEVRLRELSGSHFERSQGLVPADLRHWGLTNPQLAVLP